MDIKPMKTLEWHYSMIQFIIIYLSSQSIVNVGARNGRGMARWRYEEFSWWRPQNQCSKKRNRASQEWKQSSANVFGRVGYQSVKSFLGVVLYENFFFQSINHVLLSLYFDGIFTVIIRPSDRVQKKMENYAEIFINIMRKNVMIMQKRCQIMQKFLKLIKLFPWLFQTYKQGFW